MTTQHIDTLIIGAGQAGLATGYFLAQRGLEFLIVDGADRIGDNWRSQWDTLRLYTPAKYDGLPGMPFPADDPWHFPGKDEVGDFIESYALRWDLPVRLGTRVSELASNPDGGYIAKLGPDATDTISANQVVVATGTFGRTAYVPPGAGDLDPSIVQLHSSEYRRPSQLRDGAVLVVGASHSGMDIAYELATSRPTILCGRDNGEIPVPWESRRARIFMPVMIFVFKHVLTRRTPMGRKEMDHVRFHGAPNLRVKRGDLAARGVQRTTSRFIGTQDGLPKLEDGQVHDVANVIWCTGFSQVLDWIKLPILDDRGWPIEFRGVVDGAPGLYFCGLSYQYAFSSMVFPGVGRDAAYVADQIAYRQSEVMRHERGRGADSSSRGLRAAGVGRSV